MTVQCNVHVNSYLHKFFEPILFFDPMDYIVCGPNRNLKENEKEQNEKEQNLWNQKGHAHQT